MSTYTVTCSVCGARFTGDPPTLRATIWPHAETHGDVEVEFAGEPVILSCNCGECDYCREKAGVA